MGKVYFIILNFNTQKETIQCINSIKKLDNCGLQVEILIIDNCSTDFSYEGLFDLYKGEQNINLYRMEKNIGFSKANNWGYKFVKKRGDAEFCVVCNSDVEFIQQDFLVRVKREFLTSNFYICGPDVFCESRLKTKYKGHQSPAYPYEWNKGYVEIYYSYQKMKLDRLIGKKIVFCRNIPILFKWTICKCITYIACMTIWAKYREKRHENVPVHGSCIIVSRLFLNDEEVLFYPETKFYGEELLLYLRNKRKGTKMIYNPEIRIKHLQGRSTDALKESINTKIFKYENFATSAKVYLEELKN